ncbi:MAG: glycosyltransferase family 4 protein [Candidatus Brocadiaceae bacterium]|nr:glycosyltransferase family 4 protein [Candidatus Brocadiaceae bacterium]
MINKKLTILHINKFHYFRGGAETVYFNTARILESHGHRSVFFSMHHTQNIPCETGNYFIPHVELDEINRNCSSMHQLKIAGRIFYSFKAKKLLSQLLDAYPVDIAHLHNIYHQISPSILHVLKKRKIPIVMTLHDYKMVCATYNLYTHGKPCDDCSGRKYFMAIKNRCVKNSFSKSLVSTLEMYLHHRVLDIYRHVDIFISPSRFLKNKLLEMGFKKEIFYLPNYIDREKLRTFDGDAGKEKVKSENSIVYFGRLSREKGLMTLFEAIKLLRSQGEDKIKVKIIGDGPLRNSLELMTKSEGLQNIHFLGYKMRDELKDEIIRSLFVILPSGCYENNPMSVLESFALGKPVIASRIGGIPEIVRNDVTGETFEPGDAKDLCAKIEYLLRRPDKIVEMGKNARIFVEQELNEKQYYERLLGVYHRVLSHK